MPRRFASLVLALGLGLAAVGLPSTHAFAVQYGAQAPLEQHNARIVQKDKKCKKNDLACKSKGDAPEAPIAVALPLSGLAVFGGYILLLRRRGDTAARTGGLAV